MRFSVIIPSYNSGKFIRSCLSGILAQSVDFDFEVIVVDSSDDGTDEVIRREFSRVRLIHLDEKTIPAIARNIGMENARADELAFIDSDCIPAENWLAEVGRTLGPDCQVVCGGIINAHPLNPISIAEYFLEFREFSIYSPRRETEAFLAANFALRKEVVQKYGGFARVRASEDTLFRHNLKQHGVRVFFEPRIQVYHLNRTTLRPYLRNQQLLGTNSALARRIVSLVGSQWAFRPFIAPGLPFVRSLRTLHFVFQNRFPFNLTQALLFGLSYPWFFLGASAWSYGFYKGMRIPLEGRSPAPEPLAIDKAEAEPASMLETN